MSGLVSEVAQYIICPVCFKQKCYCSSSSVSSVLAMKQANQSEYCISHIHSRYVNIPLWHRGNTLFPHACPNVRWPSHDHGHKVYSCCTLLYCYWTFSLGGGGGGGRFMQVLGRRVAAQFASWACCLKRGRPLTRSRYWKRFQKNISC